MIKKKSGGFTLLFSFFPGCAEMYWGYMKSGISLLIMFMGVVFLASVLSVGSLMYFAFAAYVYAFFHARNMAHMTEEEVAETQDAYLFTSNSFNNGDMGGRKRSRFLAAALIVIGAWLLIKVMIDSFVRYLPEEAIIIVKHIEYTIPQIAIAILIILIGIRMVRGGKSNITEGSANDDYDI